MSSPIDHYLSGFGTKTAAPTVDFAAAYLDGFDKTAGPGVIVNGQEVNPQAPAPAPTLPGAPLPVSVPGPTPVATMPVPMRPLTLPVAPRPLTVPAIAAPAPLLAKSGSFLEHYLAGFGKVAAPLLDYLPQIPALNPYIRSGIQAAGNATRGIRTGIANTVSDFNAGSELVGSKLYDMSGAGQRAHAQLAAGQEQGRALDMLNPGSGALKLPALRDPSTMENVRAMATAGDANAGALAENKNQLNQQVIDRLRANPGALRQPGTAGPVALAAPTPPPAAPMPMPPGSTTPVGTPPAPKTVASPAPAPAAPPAPARPTAAMLSAFRRSTGSNYDPNSAVDKTKLLGLNRGLTGVQADQAASLGNRARMISGAGGAAANATLSRFINPANPASPVRLGVGGV